MSNRVTIEIDADGTAFIVGSKKVEGSMDKVAGRAKRMGKTIGNALGAGTKGTLTLLRNLTSLKGLLVSIGGIYVFKKLASSIFDARSTTERYEVTLTRLLGSQREGNRLFKELADYASKVPFEYENIMSAGVQLSGVMKGGVKEINEWMPLIGDLAAVSRLSIEETTGQVVRMYSAGAGAADLFRERGILAMMGFKAGATYSVEETRKKMMQEWEKHGSQFRGATGDLATTWTGLMSMFSDKWFAVRNRIAEGGIFEYVKDGLTLILDKINEFDKQGRLDIWAVKVSRGAVKALHGLVSFILRIPSAFHIVMSAASKLDAAIIAVLQGILTGFQKFYELLGKIPVIGGTYRELAKDIAGVNAALEGTAINLLISADAHSNASDMADKWRTTALTALEEVKKKALDTAQVIKEQGGILPSGTNEPSELTKAELQARQKARGALSQLEQQSPYSYGADGTEGMSELERIKFEYDGKKAALLDYNTSVIQEMVNAGESQAAIEQRYSELKMQYAAKERDFKLTAAAQVMGGLSNLMQNLYTLTGSKNKAMFKAMKGFAIAEAMINTYTGATRAYKDLPYPMNFAAAGSIIVAGLAQVAKISKQQPGGGQTISAGGTATPSYSGGSPNAYPVPQREESQEKKERPLVVNNHFYGDVLNNHDELARKMIPSIKKAISDGAH